MAQIKWKTKAEIEEEKNRPKPPTKEELQQEIINTLGQELAQLKVQLIMKGVM